MPTRNATATTTTSDALRPAVWMSSFPNSQDNDASQRHHHHHQQLQKEGADEAMMMNKTLMCMLVEQMREMKQENWELRHEVAELRERSDKQLREVHASLQAMNAQLGTLLSCPSQRTTSPPHTATLVGPAAQAWSPPPLMSPGVLTGAPSQRGEDLGLAEALPFLAGYDLGRLLISSLREDFMVLHSDATAPSALGRLPTVAFVSPSTLAFLRYTQEEMVGQSVYNICGMDKEAKLKLAKLSFCEPPDRMSKVISLTSCTFWRKDRPPVRVETHHQTLWADSHPTWYVVVLHQLLEDNAKPKSNPTIAEMVADPVIKTALVAKLGKLLRSRPLPLIWQRHADTLGLLLPSPSIPAAAASSLRLLSPPSSSLPSSSSEAASQEDSSAEEGIDLDELLDELRPAPSPSSSFSLLLDDAFSSAGERWLGAWK